MGFGKAYITKQGALLSAKTIQGKKINFDHFEVGSGIVNGNITDLTELIEKVAECEIKKIEIKNDTQACVSFLLKNTDVESSFYFREIGLFAIDPDTEELVLYAYANSGENAEYINNSITEKIEKYIDINILVDNASNIVINLNDTELYVTERELEKNTENLKEYVNNKNSNLQNQINSLASGSPLVANSVAKMTDTTKNYVLLESNTENDGYIYYYNGKTWVNSGQKYMETGISSEGVTTDKIYNHKINDYSNYFKRFGNPSISTNTARMSMFILERMKKGTVIKFKGGDSYRWAFTLNNTYKQDSGAYDFDSGWLPVNTTRYILEQDGYLGLTVRYTDNTTEFTENDLKLLDNMFEIYPVILSTSNNQFTENRVQYITPSKSYKSRDLLPNFKAFARKFSSNNSVQQKIVISFPHDSILRVNSFYKGIHVDNFSNSDSSTWKKDFEIECTQSGAQFIYYDFINDSFIAIPYSKRFAIEKDYVYYLAGIRTNIVTNELTADDTWVEIGISYVDTTFNCTINDNKLWFEEKPEISFFEQFAKKNEIPNLIDCIAKGNPSGLLTNDNTIISINHRGYNSEAPENTLYAFRLSKEKGFNYIETDVALSSDKVPVIIHDDTIDRTSNGTGRVDSLTLEQLKSYDFGSWKNAKFAGEKIPTFEEMIQFCKKMGLCVFIEIKNTAVFAENDLLNLVNIVKRNGMQGKVNWNSFNCNYLGIIKKYDTVSDITVVSNNLTDYIKNYITQNLLNIPNKIALSYDFTRINDEIVNFCIENNLALYAWTFTNAIQFTTMDNYISGVVSNTHIASNELYKNLIEQ